MSPAEEADKSKQDEEPKAEERSVATEPVEPAIEPTPASAPPLTVEDITSLEERHERRWLVLIFYFLMALAIAILVVFGGRWVYRAITHKNKPTTTHQPAGNNVPQQPTAPSTPTTPTTPTTTPQQGTTAPSQTSQTSRLPDNGPGNIASIFIGTAVIVGGLHYMISLRRAN